MTHEDGEVINWAAFGEARATLGAHFVKIFGYFREDGQKSVDAIEVAMRDGDSAGLVLPAHTLKGEAYQFGAERLAELAEKIEITARHFVEIQQDPQELVAEVVALRPLFEATLVTIDRELSPLVERQRGFGRRVEPSSHGLSRI